MRRDHPQLRGCQSVRACWCIVEHKAHAHGPRARYELFSHAATGGQTSLITKTSKTKAALRARSQRASQETLPRF